ncbi:MAG: LuxR C-terminal-related transcriptional regulator [Spirochaetota bacterium]
MAIFSAMYYGFEREIKSLIQRAEELQSEYKEFKSTIFSLKEKLDKAHREYMQSLSELKQKSESLYRLRRQLIELQQNVKPEDLKKYGLTTREEEVLRVLVTTHGTNKEIAGELKMSEATVKLHLWNICNKAGLYSRVDLIECFRWNWGGGYTGYETSDSGETTDSKNKRKEKGKRQRKPKDTFPSQA